jgi:SAM-dependent methyltransferase
VIVIVLATGAGCAPSADSASDTIELRDLTDALAADSVSDDGPAYDPSVRDGADVPYVTTPTALIDSMLALAGVTAEDVVYDLGSGDGRIPIRAAETVGARGVGIEIREDLVREARQRAKDAGVSDRVAFRQGDLFDADISAATVVTLYLLPSVNRALRPKLLRELEAGTRVVSRNFGMGDWTPDERVDVGSNTLYLWRLPEDPSALLSGEE